MDGGDSNSTASSEAWSSSWVSELSEYTVNDDDEEGNGQEEQEEHEGDNEVCNFNFKQTENFGLLVKKICLKKRSFLQLVCAIHQT